MQIPLLHQQIILQTERLRDLHRSLMMHNSPIPASEMESLLLEIRNLYSSVLQLSHENALQLLNEVQMAHQQSAQLKAQQASAKPISQPNDAAFSIPATPIQAEKLTTAEPPVPAASISDVAQKLGQERKKIVSDIKEKFQETHSLANSFSEHKTVGEKISGGDVTKRLSDNLKSSVTDIKSAIGLNDKFQFINHLFKGDSVKYNSVVDKLNASQTFDSAMNVVKEISEEYNWEANPSSARTFIDFIERRFSA